MSNLRQELIDSYVNEKCTSRLLPYNKNVEYFIEYSKNVVDEGDKTLKLLIDMEKNRCRFYVKEYFQTKLSKIRFSPFTIQTEYLSKKEFIFYEKYIKLLKNQNINFNEEFEGKRHEYVGFICLRNIDSILLDEETIDMKEGEFYVGNIDQVYNEILNGNIKLV